jgi:penicillin-binding protein 2B
MAPTDDPELVVYVAVQQPEIDESTNGSVPVSEIFNTVMKSSLQYLDIQPSQQEKVTPSEIPDITNMSVEKAEKQLKNMGLKPVVIGQDAKVEKQTPAAGTVALEGERVIIKTSGKIIAPDLSGWSLRDVMKFAQNAGLKLNKSGSGYVSKQSIKAGATVKQGDYLIVDLETPLQQVEAEEKAKKSKENQEDSEPTEEVTD